MPDVVLSIIRNFVNRMCKYSKFDNIIMRYALSILMAMIVATGLSAADFSVKDMTVTASDGVAMGATLTAPVSPKAVIVLATGSGTQNRDEELFGKKPFKALAEYLSRRGYAVLRVDDRGLNDASLAEKADFDRITDDVETAFVLADSIYPDLPVGILGHSCGGEYAVRIAARQPKTDFVITLAAPAWSGDSLVMSQSRAMAVAVSGKWDAEATQRELMDIVRSSAPDVTARMMLTMALTRHLGRFAEMPNVQQQIQQQVSILLQPWYRSMIRYNPADDIRAVAVPFLALNGDKDMQVLPANLTTIRELNPSADTRLMKGHNHLFQQCTSGMIDEYPKLPGTISDETLSTIATWLDSHFTAKQ